MLAEMYEHLKEAVPTHGLEIVFVSSDRDISSFNGYYQSMPWHAVPFDQIATYGQMLSVMYSVRGIPSLIILDALSGQIVVTADQSRNEVVNACRRGESAIESLLDSWLERVPSDSKEMIDLLEMSCAENSINDEKSKEAVPPLNPYLSRTKQNSKEETAALVKLKFTELVSGGMTPNEAAAQAITLVSAAQNGGTLTLPPGPFNKLFEHLTENESSAPLRSEILVKQMLEEPDGVKNVTTVVSTALKYLENAKNSPWTPKFRIFRLSNTVADRITRIKHGIDLLQSLGFEVVATNQDYCAYLSIAADLDAIHATAAKIVEQHSAQQADN